MDTQNEPMTKKQFYLSYANIDKINRLSKKMPDISAAKIVRDAIDAYDPDENLDELIAIANEKLIEAIESTERSIKIIDDCLDNLSKRKPK